MAGRPTGTVTFLFTDIDGSTKLWERDARRMQAALACHEEILKSTVEAHGGYVVKMVGDACCAAFLTTSEVLEAAVAAQRIISSEPWEEGFRLRVRMAVHTGAAEDNIDAPMLAVERPLQEPYLAAARSRLGTAAWEAAWEEGRSMTTEDAVAYALENTEDRA
jgi:Adenylate and Guanylate cyclase catalytic domain